MKKLGFRSLFRAENRGEILGSPAKVGLMPLFSVYATNLPQPGLIGKKERTVEDLQSLAVLALTNGVDDGIRTRDILSHSQTLQPAELHPPSNLNQIL